MTVSTHERFAGYAAQVDSHVINNVRSIRPKFGVQKMEITPSGAVDRLAIAMAFREGAAEITTGDLISLLTWCPAMIGYGSSGAGGLLQFQQRADGGTWQGSSEHATITSPKVFAALDEISVAQDAKEGAAAKLSIHMLTDGTNPAIAMQMLQSLTGTVAVNGIFKLGPVVYEGSNVLGVQNVVFKTGLKYAVKRSSGYVDADVGSIVDRKPMITVAGTNLSLIDGVGPGVAAVSSGLVIYFAQIGTNGQPLSGANHVSITISGGAYSTEGLSVTGENDAEGSIMCDGSGSGSSVAVSTTATLPSTLP